MGSPETTQTTDDDAPATEEPSSEVASTSDTDASDTAEASSLEPPKLYRELGRRDRWIRGALTAFTIYHLFAMLVGGATKDFKKPFLYVFGFYDEGMRMTNSWGMFGKPPGATNVTVEGVRMDGSTVLLSSTDAHDRSLKERIRDVRIRKIQGKLTELGERKRWGTHYLEWFCRTSKEQGLELRAVRAVNHLHEVKDDAGKVKRKPSKTVLFSKSCALGSAPIEFPEARRMRDVVAPREADEGGL
ncbi:MAG: hypothetical protein IPM79_36335 [Polyangiaceae bacterium]|nr:hypothetical protein [Polyangiaceae bacterium]